MYSRDSHSNTLTFSQYSVHAEIFTTRNWLPLIGGNVFTGVSPIMFHVHEEGVGRY